MIQWTVSLRNGEAFIALNAVWGYLQVPIEDKDKNKTTFTFHRGTSYYSRTPFVLWNATVTFQGALDIIQSVFGLGKCLTYIDYAVILNNFPTYEGHQWSAGTVPLGWKDSKNTQVSLSQIKLEPFGQVRDLVD